MQVVAGVNYKLKLQLQSPTGKSDVLKATVFQSLPEPKSTLQLMPLDADAEATLQAAC